MSLVAWPSKKARGGHVFLTSGAALDQVTDLSAGGSHSCAIRLGVPLCWGDNTADRLGRGSSPAGPVDRAGPVRESNADMTKVNRVRAGREFSCAINNDSKVYCWGNNSAGMLGVNTTTATESQAKLVRYLLGAFNMYIDIGRELSVGARHACTVTATGTMFCWGDNAAWQLGNGGLANQKTASVVGNGMGSQDGARGVAAGVSHTCATLASGGNVCFGDDSASESTAGPPTGVVPFAQPIRHLP